MSPPIDSVIEGEGGALAPALGQGSLVAALLRPSTAEPSHVHAGDEEVQYVYVTLPKDVDASSFGAGSVVHLQVRRAAACAARYSCCACAHGPPAVLLLLLLLLPSAGPRQ